jgi:phospholipid transport system transporter-binding protein
MLALPETLTLAQAKAAVVAVEEALGQGRVETGVFLIDAAALRTFDTAAIAVLLEARRLAQAAGRGLAVRGALPALVELAGLYGVDGLLGFEPGPPRLIPPGMALRAQVALDGKQAQTPPAAAPRGGQDVDDQCSSRDTIGL